MRVDLGKMKDRERRMIDGANVHFATPSMLLPLLIKMFASRSWTRSRPYIFLIVVGQIHMSEVLVCGRQGPFDLASLFSRSQ